jgi:hypothetical protein
LELLKVSKIQFIFIPIVLNSPLDYPISCDFNAPYVLDMDPRTCPLSAFAVLALQVANFVPECRYVIGNYRLPVIAEDALYVD